MGLRASPPGERTCGAPPVLATPSSLSNQSKRRVGSPLNDGDAAANGERGDDFVDADDAVSESSASRNLASIARRSAAFGEG